jgi:hypothetical protein
MKGEHVKHTHKRKKQKQKQDKERADRRTQKNETRVCNARRTVAVLNSK